jgi:uncharacterized protein YeaC (DUF1315 family)
MRIDDDVIDQFDPEMRQRGSTVVENGRLEFGSKFV